MTPTSVLPTLVVLVLSAQIKWEGTLASVRLGPLGLTHMERVAPEISRLRHPQVLTQKLMLRSKLIYLDFDLFVFRGSLVCQLK